jgi:hypothetical protein
MAALVLTETVPNGRIAEPTPVVLTTDNTYQSVPIARISSEEILLKVVVATATTLVTLKAGSQPLAIASGQGDLALSLTVGSHILGPFDSSRFIQNDGSLSIKAATAANVTAYALHVSRAT